MGAVRKNEQGDSEELEALGAEKPKRKRAPKKVHAGLPKGMRVRVLPSDEQAAFLRRWAGSARWTWNWALHRQEEHYRDTGKTLSTDTLSKELTIKLKEDPELEWLAQVPRTCLTQTLNDLRDSWNAYFDGISGKRADQPGKPQFKRRGGSKEGVTFQVDPRHKTPVSVERKCLRLALVGFVPAVFSEPVPGKVTAITVRRKGEHWYASLSLVDVKPGAMVRKPKKAKGFANPLDPNDPEAVRGLVAFDAAVVERAVASNDGKTTFSLRDAADRARQELKLEKKKKFQRWQARKQNHRLREMGLNPRKPIPKGTKIKKSRRQEKLDRKVAGIDLKMLFHRQDQIHKFTTELVRQHHTIVVETLCLAAMAQTLSRGFRRRMHEACMGEILRQLKYKSKLYGRTLLFVDRWFPSSKRCSNPACHQKNSSLKLSDRAWTCPHCQTRHERDANAAFNLWQEGWRLLREQQASTSCSNTTVGSTGIARRGAGAGTAETGAGQGRSPVKRERSRQRSEKILAATFIQSDPAARMERGAGSVG